MNKLALIVPCYNPETGWEERLIEHYTNFLQANDGVETQLVLVNDGSTVAAVNETAFTTLRKVIPTIQIVNYSQNRGKGYALRQGVAAITADYYLFTDIDFPYLTESMVAVQRGVLKNGGIVVGHRKTDYYEKVPFFRTVLSKTFRGLLKGVLNLPVEDSQCGLKGFDAAGKEYFLETEIDRFLFDLEFLVLATDRVPIRSVHVQLKDNIVFSSMGLGILQTEFFNFVKILRKRVTKRKIAKTQRVLNQVSDTSKVSDT
ncbi:MAG: glycosyltransferase [Saprospiraceae bacterium]